MNTPGSWKPYLDATKVDVVPLVDDTAKSYPPGWCTSGWTLLDSPEVEVFCSGINTKTPTHAGLWRQGNLLHFGFEQSPATMNATGQALLVNAITYISRFTDDRPIPITPSGFAGKRVVCRAMVDLFLSQTKLDLKSLQRLMAASALESVNPLEPETFRAWFTRERGFLRPDAEGKFSIDAEVKSLGVPFDAPEFIARAIAALGDSEERAALARRLLDRYVPEGPGATATEESWQTWLAENRAFVFFSDSGGYRWYIDPLAKERRVPTDDLRGPERASAEAAMTNSVR